MRAPSAMCSLATTEAPVRQTRRQRPQAINGAKLKHVLLMVPALLFAHGATAQEIAPCGGSHAEWLADHADEMTGLWTDTVSIGLMMGQPMPLGPPEQVRLTAIPNGFSARGEEPVRTYEMLLADAPFPIQPPGGAATLARIDSEIPHCGIDDPTRRGKLPSSLFGVSDKKSECISVPG